MSVLEKRTRGSAAQTYALIAAAGSGKRMGSAENKIFLELNGLTVLERSLLLFEAMPDIKGIQVIVSEADRERVEALLKRRRFEKILPLCLGGVSRQDSILNGLEALERSIASTEAKVLIHDAARCLLRAKRVSELIDALDDYEGAVLAVPVKDTIKRVTAGGSICETLKRSELVQVQTPQAFYLDSILYWHRMARREGLTEVTDDASLAEHYGAKVQVLLSDYENIKLTTREDIALAKVYLER